MKQSILAFSLVFSILFISSCSKKEMVDPIPEEVENNTGNVILDPAFFTGSGFRGDQPGISVIETQLDGKILAAGRFDRYNSTTASCLVRLNVEGSIDPTFNSATGFNFVSPPSLMINSIAIQKDGKIVVGGQFNSYNGQACSGIVRLNKDGSIDNAFGTGISGSFSFVKQVLVQEDGKIVIIGSFTHFSGVETGNLIRVNADGTLDTGFATLFKGRSALLNCISIQSDDKILVGGDFSIAEMQDIGRLNPNGTPDATFANENRGIDAVECMCLLPNAKMLVSGTKVLTGSSTDFIYFSRLNSNGSTDPSFSTASNFKNLVQKIVVDNNGKVYAGGLFSMFGTKLSGGLVRMNTDGSFDSSFRVEKGVNSFVKTIKLQSDGKVLIGGQFSSYRGALVNNIARIKSL